MKPIEADWLRYCPECHKVYYDPDILRIKNCPDCHCLTEICLAKEDLILNDQ